MKPRGGKKYLIIAILCFSIACAGITPVQEDAIARSAGNALAITLMATCPNALPVAERYCIYFDSTHELFIGQAILEALSKTISDEIGDRRIRRLARRIQANYRFQAHLLSRFAERREETLFDWLVGIIVGHLHIELRLE